MHQDAYDPAEFWSRDQIEATQLTRLKNVVARVYKKNAFYRKRLDEAGVSPESIRSLDDIERIPFTTKDDLRSQYPLGLVIVPEEELVRLHCSSGTTGTPVAIAHTQNDLNTWADLMARCLHMVGVRREDVFQNMSGYGLFTGGLGIHSGAERLGCMTIPAGPGNTARQIKLVKDFHTTVAHILPSYALILGERIREMGENPADLPLRIAVVGAEPYTAAFRQRIEDLFNMKVYNSYGLSEMNGPGVAFECQEQNGLHIWEDAYFAEIVDPETGRHVAPGEVGELVMTTLVREGMPILRYRTRDLTRFLPGTCPCGRLHHRMDRILGRSDDMFICKGVNIYPQQIEDVLMKFPEVGRNYLILLDNDNVGDILRVQVEIREEYFVEDLRVLRGLQNRIAHALRSEILVTPRIELVQSNSLPVSDGKAVRFKDQRNSK
ncbi:MAG TPA: phenylacetate--CoA ligase [Candidatus Desulfovibrio intestinipullorum]|uniref:Phenylacetate-coenzyme A ligase n=1 Tax=Candidatus Desulfovibrio intestinipullorum TaxID=2838536 RepID=A0A9D1TPN1_9BACT|nr:phenylacetate--CoA ligase [Candidatus Desulfovibrio intestinipullorum]